jgi:CHAT domain-containing protein/Tfp pilus assembly protein PilF
MRLVQVLPFKTAWRMHCRRALIYFALCAGTLPVSATFAQTSPSIERGPCQSFKSSADRFQQLEYGKSVAHELAAGGEDEYCVTLAAGQHARVHVRPKGIRLKIELYDGSGTLLVRWEPPDVVDLVGDAQKAYVLRVRPEYVRLEAVKYELLLAAASVATDEERALFEARKKSTAAAELQSKGELREAVRFETEAVRLAEQSAPHSLYLADLLVHLADIQVTAGDVQNGGQNYTKAKLLAEEAGEGGDGERALALTGLGFLAVRKQEFAEADKLLGESLEIARRVYGENDPKIALCLLRIGMMRQRRGDLQRAKEEMQKALAIDERVLAPDDPSVLQILDSYADVFIDDNDWDGAKPILERTLALAEKTMGPSNYFLSHQLQNLGIVARHQKDNPKALDYFWRAEKIREHTFGERHAGTGTLLVNIGNVYAALGDYPHALETYQRALDILQETLGPYHEWSLMTLSDVSRAYLDVGDVPRAVEYLKRENQGVEETVSMNLIVGSEQDRLAYIEKFSDTMDETISMNVQGAPDDRNARELALLAILRRKGRVQDALADNLSTLRLHLQPEDQELLDQLKTTTAALAKASLGGDPTGSDGERTRQIALLEQKREKFEIEIGERSQGYIERTNSVTVDAVKAALPDDAGLVEFSVYEPFDVRVFGSENTEPHYIAYVLSKNHDVQWKELGTAREIDQVVQAFRKALLDPSSSGARELGRKLDELIFRPVRNLAAGVPHWIISPDGQLNFVPFEALVNEQGRFLLENHSISYLTTGRDLLRMKVAMSSRSAPLLVANPLFGEPSAERAALKEVAANERARDPHRSITVGDDRSNIYFTPLSGSTQEAKQLRSLFPSARILSGADASKSHLDSISAPEILHIATHGFFLNDVGSVAAAPAPDSRGINASAKVNNPLLRSGLALAGANVDSPGQDNGILTALEASNLDLWGTKLVTLSACDTGVGEVKNGEGVYGLRRAFILAGAEAVVTSLWSVSDYATRELMRDYYAGMKHGEGRGEALRQAKLAMLKRKGREHPFYWASFIQFGNWTNLDGK